VLIVSPDEAARVVREFGQQKYDFIKVYNGLSREVYDRIVQTGTRIFVGITGVALLPRMTPLLRYSVSGNLLIPARSDHPRKHLSFQPCVT
jgi:hypothetical protein